MGGILDEADEALLNDVIASLEAHRRENWVDLHNLRIIKYGSLLHLDCHLTVPWYFQCSPGAQRSRSPGRSCKDHFGTVVELLYTRWLSVPTLCYLLKTACNERKQDFCR